MELTQTLGNMCVAVASVLWTVELIPQIVKTLKCKSVGDISIWWLLTCFTAYTIYLTGMVLHGNWWYFFTHLIPASFTVFFISLLLKYRIRAPKKDSKILVPIVKAALDLMYIKL